MPFKTGVARGKWLEYSQKYIILKTIPTVEEPPDVFVQFSLDSL